MVTLSLDAPDVYEETEAAIQKGEPFSIVVKGFRGKMVKKMIPSMKWGLEGEKRTQNRVQLLLSALYMRLTKGFAGLYFEAVQSGMIAEVEETASGVVVVFSKIQEESRLEKGLRAVLEKKTREGGKG
ncbi:hypothetical protein [Candidatus Nitronereus thalassa]|uniref:Uncharacterized protein n=1 Tax=Candidatus Nitronereus thalassa TaxID=3020898 RepID=A0ABU3K9U1_9BACT|nr:hypothetical protein [Candidatus Nitronereus thalassa]MDT7043063.1 hypothetical protein [Candidatus Nitronereus thalassa]